MPQRVVTSPDRSVRLTARSFSCSQVHAWLSSRGTVIFFSAKSFLLT
jgi:hypothetical protein